MGRMYVTGRIIEIDPKHFNGAVMMKVEEPKPVETKIPDNIATAIINAEVATVPQEPVLPGLPSEETKPKSKRVLKTDAY